MVHPKRAVASRRGMPMLDIKCQSLQPDADWGCSAILLDGDTVEGDGGSTARTPQGSLCGDNTSLIESRIGELTSRFWVKARTLARKRRRVIAKEDELSARTSPSRRDVERTFLIPSSSVFISQLEEAIFIR